MVYGYTKITEYTRFHFRKLQSSILPYKKGLPYWWYTSIRRLQSIQDFILENFNCQFYLTKRGFHIDGLRLYKDYRKYKIYFRKLQTSILLYKKGLPHWWYTDIRRLQSIQTLFWKLKKSILTYKKGLPYWWYTGIRRLQSIQDLISNNFKHQFYPTKRGFHIDGIGVYENYRVYKI